MESKKGYVGANELSLYYQAQWQFKFHFFKMILLFLIGISMIYFSRILFWQIVQNYFGHDPTFVDLEDLKMHFKELAKLDGLFTWEKGTEGNFFQRTWEGVKSFRMDTAGLSEHWEALKVGFHDLSKRKRVGFLMNPLALLTVLYIGFTLCTIAVFSFTHSAIMIWWNNPRAYAGWAEGNEKIMNRYILGPYLRTWRQLGIRLIYVAISISVFWMFSKLIEDLVWKIFLLGSEHNVGFQDGTGAVHKNFIKYKEFCDEIGLLSYFELLSSILLVITNLVRLPLQLAIGKWRERFNKKDTKSRAVRRLRKRYKKNA